MRVMVIVKASRNSEAGAMPSAELLSAMQTYNEELVAAGVMKAGDGLHPTSRGARVTFGQREPQVTRGPFAPAEGQVAGFWIWRVDSLENAIEWARRCPNPMPDEAGVLEIRPIFEAEDFGDAMSDELKGRERRLMDEIAGKT